MKAETEDLENNMIKIALATSNPHKLEEINDIIEHAGMDGVEFVLVGEGFDPEEDGETFEENSYIKAFEAAKIMGIPALADDTGLCVDALDGRPGLYSARYAPDQKSKIEKLLSEMKDVPKEKRGAHFICTMVLTAPGGQKIHSQTGKIEGFISEKPSGAGGFGYDPLFFIPELNKTMAEMTLEEKNTMSHRARALLPMIEKIRNLK